MGLSIVNVAYPLAPVGFDAVGGAEQIVSAIDAALVAAGHESVVVAAGGSTAEGELIELPAVSGTIGPDVRRAAQVACRERLEQLLRSRRPDVVHFHGVDCLSYLPGFGPPALCTLHLPPDWYPPALFQRGCRLQLQCVSASQRASCPEGTKLLPDVPNGVDIARFAPAASKEPYALMLSRICPEKGVHLALEAAQRAGIPLRLAGRVFPYVEHQRYFEEEVAPRLDRERTFLGPIGMPEKAELLARARCVVIPSLVAETSSLVAMEALASGTPVVAFRIGALPDIVEHGRTGYIAESCADLAAGLRACEEIRPEECRREAERRFSLEHTCNGYLALYERLAHPARRRASAMRVNERTTQPDRGSGRRLARALSSQ